MTVLIKNTEFQQVLGASEGACGFRNWDGCSKVSGWGENSLHAAWLSTNPSSGFFRKACKAEIFLFAVTSSTSQNEGLCSHGITRFTQASYETGVNSPILWIRTFLLRGSGERPPGTAPCISQEKGN